ncbi:MAG: YDG domain-containing protein, partial [Candidatus Omnitrophica bacterium]|nr:YDG domain-containing protein [Candidatus Omnitrophota bacterium]MDD5592598.1 YDG domain-containing protein [Candidatus Omnitrophota bacterium]
VADTTGEITQKSLTVTAVTDTKAYDDTTSSTGVPTITSGSLASGDTATWTQTFDNKNVGTGKTLTPAGTVNDGNGGLNYNVTFVNNTTGVITPAAASKLVFIQQPTDTTAGSNITPAIKVEIRDAYDNLLTADSTSTITISLQNNPGSGGLSGTLTQTTSNGVATFSGLSINKAGSGYALKAASGTLNPAISASFNIAANPSDSQLSNAEVIRALIEVGLYQFTPFTPGGGAGYLYHPITPTDASAFEQFMLQASDYSFFDGVLNYTGNQELTPFFQELDKKGQH